MKDKVLVVYGGKSVEHDISIITAMQVMKNLPQNWDFLPCYIDRNGIFWIGDNLENIKIYKNFQKLGKGLQQVSLLLGENVILVKKHKKFVKYAKICAVLNCCHGNIGEDGALAGVCKACDLAQTSPKITSSALCMDKAFMKDICKSENIKTPSFAVIKKQNYVNGSCKTLDLKKIKYPCVVKPCNLGSSIGISVCHSEKELSDAIELAFEFDKKILIEDLVQNLQEFNCACFRFHGEYFVSNVNEVTNKGEMFSFDDKYLSTSNANIEVEKNLARKIQKLTKKVYDVLDCEGVVRADFLYDKSAGELYVNEVNTIPGSLAFYLFKDVKFMDILYAIISESLSEKEREMKLITTFDSEALDTFINAANTLKK